MVLLHAVQIARGPRTKKAASLQETSFFVRGSFAIWSACRIFATHFRSVWPILRWCVTANFIR